MRIYNAADEIVFDYDDIPGYVAPASPVTEATPKTPVVAKTSAYTVLTTDRGKLFNCNPTGGSFDITLPSAVTAGDNFRVGFRHNGTANVVSLKTVSSQNIRANRNGTTYTLGAQGEAVWLVSDGDDWSVDTYAPPLVTRSAPVIVLADRLTSPLAYPAAGTRYLINGTPTGAWQTLGFAQNQIVEADGAGSWFAYTPQEGWLAHDSDSSTLMQYRGSSWVEFSNAALPTTTSLKTMVVKDVKAQGTDGGTATATTWTTSVLNTTESDTIGGNLASNTITLPAGTYRVRASKVFMQTRASRIRWKTSASNDVIIYGNVVQAGFLSGSVTNNARSGATAVLDGIFTISANTDFILQYYVEATVDGEDLGAAQNASSVSEVYATVVIENMAVETLQGATGAQGPQGAWNVVGASAVQASHTGNTNETTLATITVPAGSLGANGALRIHTQWSNNNNANNKIMRIRLGGPSGTIYLSATVTTTIAFLSQIVIRAVNSQSSQKGSGTSVGTSSTAAVTSSLDMTADFDLVLTGQHANSGDSVALESNIVAVLYSP